MAIEVNIVLVRTLYDANIGYVSRLMDNFDCRRLILIDPRCEVSYSAQLAASRGQRALQERVQYGGWKEFYNNENPGLSIAFTARPGMVRPTLDYAYLVEHQLKPENLFEGAGIYLIFGPEDSGLSNEDLEFVHWLAKLKVSDKNPSLNLSHAVGIAMALLFSKLVESQSQSLTIPSEAPLPTSNEELDGHLKDFVKALGFQIEDRRKSAYTTLKRVILKGFPNSSERHVLQAIFAQAARKLSKKV
jgi:tRNA/rRNA methyltransferase